jgi:hypothetical protein
MDPSNYKNIKQKRINATTKLADVNELEPDFEIQLKDGKDNSGETYPRNVKVIDNIISQKYIDNQIYLKTSMDKEFNDIVESLESNDIICDEFNGKKKFTFIFSLNGLNPFHVYNYTILLSKGYEMTIHRMYKIACQSARHVVEDTLAYLHSMNASNDVLFDVDQKLKELEIDYVGVKIKGNVIYISYSGFEFIDPRNML